MLFLELKIFDLNLCETMKFFIRLINYGARRCVNCFRHNFVVQNTIKMDFLGTS